jgi:hypothetical protein
VVRLTSGGISVLRQRNDAGRACVCAKIFGRQGGQACMCAGKEEQRWKGGASLVWINRMDFCYKRGWGIAGDAVALAGFG